MEPHERRIGPFSPDSGNSIISWLIDFCHTAVLSAYWLIMAGNSIISWLIDCCHSLWLGTTETDWLIVALNTEVHWLIVAWPHRCWLIMARQQRSWLIGCWLFYGYMGTYFWKNSFCRCTWRYLNLFAYFLLIFIFLYIACSTGTGPSNCLHIFIRVLVPTFTLERFYFVLFTFPVQIFFI